MELKLENDIELWWGTPVFALTWPEAPSLNADLKALILDRRTRSSGVVKSNLGGWHSTDDMLTWPSPAVVTLKKWILEGLRKATQSTGKGQGYSGSVKLSCWANINGPGHANDVHNHPQAAWSGVYYVDVGTPVDLDQKSGFIHFQDPRAGAGMCQDPFGKFGKGREFNPINGQMLFFPSWLLHGVRAYRGEGDRISVAFNISLLDLM